MIDESHILRKNPFHQLIPARSGRSCPVFQQPRSLDISSPLEGLQMGCGRMAPKVSSAALSSTYDLFVCGSLPCNFDFPLVIENSTVPLPRASAKDYKRVRHSPTLTRVGSMPAWRTIAGLSGPLPCGDAQSSAWGVIACRSCSGSVPCPPPKTLALSPSPPIMDSTLPRFALENNRAAFLRPV